MAWKATTQKETGVNGTRLLAVIYVSDSGDGSVIDRYDITPDIEQRLLPIIKDKLETLAKQDVLLASVSTGDWSEKVAEFKSPEPIIVVEDPLIVAARQAEEDFQRDYQSLKFANNAVVLGVIDNDNTELVALRNDLRKRYKTDYFRLLF